MTFYQNFIGIDISKSDFVVALSSTKKTYQFENDEKGWSNFHNQFRQLLPNALVVLETTGGYELGLLLYLNTHNVAVHRANTRQAKSFIRSLGKLAKTDDIDAGALARYGQERHQTLPLFKVEPEALDLHDLSQRRIDLNKMLVQEKNRFKAPRGSQAIKDSCRSMIKALEKQIEAIDKQIDQYIQSNKVLKQKQSILQTIPGIGPTIARNIICLMPELGQMNQKQVASLAGLAPHPFESGSFKGRRCIKGGLKDVRNTLFLAAMAASNSDSRLKAFYNKLVNNGKKRMVALSALMRKIIVIANAKVKEELYAL